MKKCIVIIFCVLSVSKMRAQEGGKTVNIVTTAAPFLRITPDARSGGMGETAIGVSQDPNSVFNNLAKTVFSPAKAGIAMNYNPWSKETADDMYLATLSGFYKPGEDQVFGAGLRYFSLGNVPLVDYNGNKLMTSSPREFAFDLGYARKLSSKFGIGLTGHFIHSKLATGNVSGIEYKAGTAVAADISVFYSGKDGSGKGWSGGLTLANLGTKISYTDEKDQGDFIPASIGVGAAYTEVWDEDNHITLAADLNKLLVPAVPTTADGMKDYRETGVVKSWFESFDNQSLQIGVGLEYEYKDLLALRLGYNRKSYAAGSWQQLSVGAGLSLSSATVNFAYIVPTGDKTSRNPLTNTIRVGLLYSWGSK